VVHAGQNGNRAVLDALNDPELPERSLPIQGTARDVADDVGELLRIPRCRHCDVADVIVDVEIGIVEPHRPVQVERNVGQPAPEFRQEREP
jgi:hypothetical protein